MDDFTISNFLFLHKIFRDLIFDIFFVPCFNTEIDLFQTRDRLLTFAGLHIVLNSETSLLHILILIIYQDF